MKEGPCILCRNVLMAYLPTAFLITLWLIQCLLKSPAGSGTPPVPWDAWGLKSSVCPLATALADLWTCRDPKQLFWIHEFCNLLQCSAVVTSYSCSRQNFPRCAHSGFPSTLPFVPPAIPLVLTPQGHCYRCHSSAVNPGRPIVLETVLRAPA